MGGPAHFRKIETDGTQQREGSSQHVPPRMLEKSTHVLAATDGTRSGHCARASVGSNDSLCGRQLLR